MVWVFMMIQITSVLFILGLNLKEIRGRTTLPLASFVRKKTRGNSLNHNMPGFDILIDNYGCKNKNKAIICFLNMIKEGGLFGSANFYFYIKGHTKNDCGHAFNSLKVLWRKQDVFNSEKFCEIWIPERMLKLFKYSMRSFLTWNNSCMISKT